MARRAWLLLLVCLTMIVAALAPLQVSNGAAVHAGKQHCHTVTKTVHGKRKRVKVCTKSGKHGSTKKHATPKPTPTPEATPTATSVPYDQIATQLAAAVEGASSDDSRYTALVAALAALKVPVRATNGTDVTPVTPTSGFFLPESWVHSLVRGFAEKKRASFDSLAQVYDAAQMKVEGGAPTASSVRGATVSAVAQAAAGPTDSHHLADLLLLQLGLHQSPAVDLRQAQVAAALDPLQFFILLVEGLLPASGTATSSAMDRVAARSPLARSGQSALPSCPAAGVVMPGESWDQNFDIASDSRVRVDLWAVVGVGIEYFYNLDITGDMPAGSDTHYGPAGHAPNAGKALAFHVHAEEFASASASCANPPFVAPVGNAGFDLHWQYGDLQKYGVVDPGRALVTDSAGEAVLNFQPNEEQFPGFGAEVTHDVTVTATPGFDFKITDPVLRSMLGSMFATQPLVFTAHISLHQPRGFAFSGVHLHYWSDIGVHVDTYRTYSGHLCGSDPYAAPWSIHVAQSIVEPSGTYNTTQDFTWDYRTSKVNPGTGDWLEIIPGASPQMSVSWGATPPIQPAHAVQSVPITEDTTCPEPGS
jgi:hypothetical protein